MPIYCLHVMSLNLDISTLDVVFQPLVVDRYVRDSRMGKSQDENL